MKKKEIFGVGTEQIEDFDNEVTFSRYDPDIKVNYKNLLYSDIVIFNYNRIL